MGRSAMTPWTKVEVAQSGYWAVMEGEREVCQARIEADADAIVFARELLSDVVVAWDRVDREIAEFGTPVSSEYWGFMDQAIANAEMFLDSPQPDSREAFFETIEAEPTSQP